MSQSSFCEQCGAALTPEMRFCEACGRPVAPTAEPALPTPSAAVPVASAEYPVAPRAAPPAAAPRPAKRGLIVGLGIVGLIVVLGCLAVGLFGFLLMKNQPGASGGLPVNTSQVGAVSPRAPQSSSTQSAPIAPVVQDAKSVLITAQALVTSFQSARFTFDCTDGTTTSKGSGWLLNPDRARYTLDGGTERVIVRNQMWSRPNSTAAWTSEIYVGPLNNPIAWLQIVQCVTSPRVMPASTASGETFSTLSFILASNAASCASAGSVQALSGEGTIALRPQNGGIARLYYNLVYTGQQLRGGVNAPLQITVEFSDWNNGNLPAIEVPR